MDASIRNGTTPTKSIPSSSRRGCWLPPTTTIFPKKSPVLRADKMIITQAFCLQCIAIKIK